MTIKEAKRHIEDTVKVYLTKDEFGRYVVPVERQRPVFLLRNCVIESKRALKDGKYTSFELRSGGAKLKEKKQMTRRSSST